MSLKLGSETVSVVNWIQSGHIGQPEPTIGMGATFLHWTDRSAGTVIGFDGKTLLVQDDSARRIDTNGMSECQVYDFTPNPGGTVHQYRKDRRGQWRPVVANERGRLVFAGSPNLRLGSRGAYHDFSF